MGKKNSLFNPPSTPKREIKARGMVPSYGPQRRKKKAIEV
jgi:hypothetical protein